MKRFYLLLAMIALVLSACNSNKVKIRGKVADFKGDVKLLAEMPGKQGLEVLAQQNVTDGNIDLVTESLQIPARVWVDVQGKKEPLVFIVDTKDQIWIEGRAKYLDEIVVKNSGLGDKYDDLKKMFKDKYEAPIEPLDRAIQRIQNKEKTTKDDEVMLGVHQLQRQRYVKARARYVKNLVEANPESELSLFLIKDELKDSVDLQKRLFKLLKVQNQESNIYKNLAATLQ